MAAALTKPGKFMTCTEASARVHSITWLVVVHVDTEMGVRVAMSRSI